MKKKMLYYNNYSNQKNKKDKIVYKMIQIIFFLSKKMVYRKVRVNLKGKGKLYFEYLKTTCDYIFGFQ